MRIRSIKPEFWESESLGRVSRDARLLFIGLWMIADDSGRARGGLDESSRFLARVLFPYDDDAKDQISCWLDELIKEGCVINYEVDGSHYLFIPKFLSHQRIDRPSKSKYPPFIDTSTNTQRILASVPYPSHPIPSLPEGGSKGETEKPNEEPKTILNHPPLKECQEHFRKCSDYTGEQVRQAFQQFEASTCDGSWMWGKRAVTDWRAAMESRMSENRARSERIVSTPGGRSPKTAAQALTDDLENLVNRALRAVEKT